MNTEATLTGLVAVATLGAALFIAAPAYADTTRSVQMTYSASELETPEGAEKVMERIENSARKVCRPSSHERMTASAVLRYQACRQEAVDRAIEDISSTELDAAIKANANRG